MPNSTHGGLRPPDGIFGEETETVLKKFQSAQGLVADGIAGPKTLGRIDQVFQRKDPFYEDPVLAQTRLNTAQYRGFPPFSIRTNLDFSSKFTSRAWQ